MAVIHFASLLLRYFSLHLTIIRFVVSELYPSTGVGVDLNLNWLFQYFFSCEGKSSCSFKADATLGDPCPGYGKFTSICYNCISSTQGGALVLFISFCICKHYIGGKQTNTYG